VEVAARFVAQEGRAMTTRMVVLLAALAVLMPALA
jgi:hypothetical protein